MVSLDDLFTKPRRSVASYGEVLPWFGMVAPGLVLCHDGSLIAGFTYEGEDIEGATSSEINQRIDFLQNAMRQLTDRITIWFVQERRNHTEYNYVDYPSAMSGLVDWEWGKSLTSTPNARIKHSLYIGFSYPSKTEAFFEELRAEMDAASNGFKALGNIFKKRLKESSAIGEVRGRLAEMVDEFEQTMADFSSIVTSNLGFQRMFEGDLLGDLYSRANLASPSGPISLGRDLSYLNTVLPADDLVRQGDLLQFKGPARETYAAVLSTTGLPATAVCKHVDDIMASPCEYILVQTFKFLDSTETGKIIQKAEEFYRNEVKSVMVRLFEQITKIQSDKVNTGNLVLAQDAQDALVDLTANEMVFGYYNMTFLALGDTQKDALRSADIISTRLRTAGYSVTRERQGLFGGFLGTLPGNSKTQLRRYLVTAANVADLAPIRTIFNGIPNHPLFSETLGRQVPAHVRFMTGYGVPYDWNLHAEDLGHAIVIGGSGSGKTSFVQLIISQFQKYYPCNTYIFDKDRSMAILSVLLGGKHIDLANPKSTGIRMNPVRRMLQDGEVLALTKWVTILMASQGEVLPAEDMEKISAAIQRMSSLSHYEWRLGTLYTILNGQDKRLARRLSAYVDRSEDEEGEFGKGIFADYFDNEEDDFEVGSLICMETGKILQTEQISAPFMDYAFYCIEKSLDGHTPTFIYVEEAWYMLANPAFEARIDDWLRTFRKKKAFVVFATQSPYEFRKLQAWSAFIANVPTYVFLRSIKDSVDQLADTYRELFSLNDAQLDLLRSARPKRDYLLIKPECTRLVNATMPHVLTAINEATTKDGALETAKAYAERGGEGWELNYLMEELNVQIN